MCRQLIPHSSFPIFSLISRNSKSKCEHVAHFMLQAAPLYVALLNETLWYAEDYKPYQIKDWAPEKEYKVSIKHASGWSGGWHLSCVASFKDGWAVKQVLHQHQINDVNRLSAWIWAGGMRKRFDFSLLHVFQERHAAEVRRNKELQVELSGWKQQWWMWPIPTISKLPLPILLWIMRYKYGKCMTWFKKK